MPHVSSSVPAQAQVHSHTSGSRRRAPGGCRRPNWRRRGGRPATDSRAGADRRQEHFSRPERGVLPASEKTASPPKPADDWRKWVDLGLLSKLISPQLVEEELARHDLRPGRGLLSFPRTIWLVLGLCVFASAPYQEVLQRLWHSFASGPEPVPNKSSLCRARYRLGWKVLAGLFLSIARPLAKVDSPGAFWRGLRVMAIDGFTLEVPGSAANEQAFGGQKDKRGRRVGFPQIRLLGLVECGTRALLGAALGSYRDGEPELASQLIRSLTRGMLVLADRGFFGVVLWQAYRDAGAHLLWRIKGNVAIKVLQRLPDGTYLARVRPSHQYRRWPPGQRPAAIIVRVIEYRINGSRQLYRLATDLLDPMTAPAKELARLYTQRWEFETVADELKTHQRGGGVVLRSCTPDGVQQEVWAHLILHYSARSLIYEAACTIAGDGDPDLISFTLALRIIRRSLLWAPFLTHRADLLANAIAELTQPRALVHPRHRTHPRSVRRPASRYQGPPQGQDSGLHRTPAPFIQLAHGNH